MTARAVASLDRLTATTRGPAGWLDRSLRAALGLLLLVMTLTNVANAATRYLFGVQMTGTDEFLAYGMVWLVMLGVPVVTAARRNLALDVLAGLMGDRMAALRDALIHALTAIVCLYGAWQSWGYIAKLVAIDSKSMALGVPMAVPHAALFVGLSAVAVVGAALLVRDVARLLGGRGTTS